MFKWIKSKGNNLELILKGIRGVRGGMWFSWLDVYCDKLVMVEIMRRKELKNC